ncbi:MAG: PBP1A family penicillin-binding protein [Rhizobiaceae bacterium]|nr:PBP1A family penicillin-binding protein [Rhizobiaceae bacterium]
MLRRDSRSRPKAPRAGRAMAIDAWLDSTVYSLGFRLRAGWESLTIFFRRFRVRGWRRALVELGSEAMTMGAGGAVVMLALAMPAFEETEGDWRNHGDFAVTFTDRYGNEIGQRGLIQRDSIPVDQMPDFVVNAVLATEDRRFFEHYGIDFIGLARAMNENMRANSVVQGGSTLTQQLAKNLFLSNERTVERKVKEAFLSLWLEMNLTKKEILQLYLDRAYMGGGTFGITAAADFYFGKQVKDLTLAEAAMLAGLFKAPTKYAPHINLPAARARANEVLTNMVQGNFLTEGQVLSARLHPADIIDRGDLKAPDYFLDWAFEEAKRIASKYGIHSMVARTTADINIQRASEEAIEYHLRQFGKDYRVTEGAVVVMETNGAVRAIVGGRDYGASQFNRATKAERQVGSSFKPYVYATAMEAGMTPETVISDGPISWGNWSPKNYGRSFSGRVTLASALARSINTVPVRLAKEKLGIDPIVKLTYAMGVESKLNEHKTMVLGTSGMTVMDQATGYNTMADGGFAGVRYGITQLRTRSGEVFYDHSRDAPPPHRVLTDQSVAYMNTMLAGVNEAGTGRRAAMPLIRSAGKTGTTQSYRDAWYVGFTGNYTAAVWLGNDDFTPSREMTGGSLPAMVWNRLMTHIHQNIDLKPIPGLEKPFVDPEIIAKAKREAAESKTADAPSEPELDAPRVLSSDTTRVLRQMTDRFSRAEHLEAPAPAALTAL